MAIRGNPRLLDQILAPAIHILGNYVRGVYRDGPLNVSAELKTG